MSPYWKFPVIYKHLCNENIIDFLLHKILALEYSFTHSE
uniref:Bm13426 n=1 Tax=Brugia malayi TaxID=6279 RepID=A0A1I9G1J1_BRUMA|nr:Bm13426 [Brugia malayi]